MAAAFAQPWADVVLSGAVTESQLTENLAAQDLEATARDGLEALAIPPREYWAERGRLEWQ
jgi:aryl-alcohol dehydrogenase-like predicted oxidoreductase